MTKKKENPQKGGRPAKIDDLKLQKLREAFLRGYSDEEACIYADIGTSTLYNYQNKNPLFVEQKEIWKRNPILKAKDTVFNNLNDSKVARWYLEHKSDEFNPKSKFEITGKNGEPLAIKKVFVTPEEVKEAEKHIDNVIKG